MAACGERETLQAFLDDFRDIVVRKASGLSDADARRHLVPSATTVGGLVKHLRWAEYGWFDQLLQERVDCCKNELCGAISRERDERKCADNTIVTYTNATFYPKMVADITTGTGTTPQSTYNPLPVSTCGCNCGR